MTDRLQTFLRNEAAGGMVMLFFAALAMMLANSSHASVYNDFIGHTLHFGAAEMKLRIFVNDVLMAIFFLAVGMELKREMLQGFLSTTRERTLPLIAALGGIALPAAIYLLINDGIAAHANGWAIPTATDIAFAVCVLSLLGNRVPPAAKIFLLAIAIYDDLAAILIIALFYSGGVALNPLLWAAGTVGIMVWLNRQNRSPLLLYLMLGAALWHFVHEAGIHTTVAGMITGLLIPFAKRHGHSTLEHFLHHLHPFVAFLVLPLFAFVSAGVDLSGITPDSFTDTLPLGIAAGLFFGKQLGIFGATYGAVKLGFAPRPKGASWPVIYSVSLIAGIGFTMSLFIGLLAFQDESLHKAIKLGVFAGSLASAIMGAAMLRLALRG